MCVYMYAHVCMCVFVLESVYPGFFYSMASSCGEVLDTSNSHDDVELCTWGWGLRVNISVKQLKEAQTMHVQCIMTSVKSPI